MSFRDSFGVVWGRFIGLNLKVRLVALITLGFLLSWAFFGVRSCSEAGRDSDSEEAHQEWVKGDWSLQSEVNILRGELEQVKQAQAAREAKHAEDIAKLTRILSERNAANERSSSTRRNYRNVKAGRSVPNVDKPVPTSELRDVVGEPGP